MRFFDKWKKKQMGKLGKKLMKDNPQLEKDMEKFSELTDKSKDIFPSIEKNISAL